MSKYPYTRIAHWKEEEDHTYGKVLHENLTYDEATKLEREEAVERGCYYKHGGKRDDTSDWAVYYVSGGWTP